MYRILILILLVTPARALGVPVSLFLVSGVERETIEGLLEEGVVVSRTLDGMALVYGADRARALLDRLGPYRILEADTEGREHYLAFFANRSDLERVRAPLELLHAGPGVAVVSAPEDMGTRVAELGFDVERLFRTPMRLPPRERRMAISGRHLGAASEACIDGLVQRVSTDTLDTSIFELEGFGSRRASRPGGRRAAAWVEAKFRSYGFEDIEVHRWTPSYPGNVIATLPGTATPEEVVVIGGHYDSIVPQSMFEPGADDNASGTAALLECARILAPHQFMRTVHFVAFSAEELGLLGSEAYANRAQDAGENVVAMLNLDMLGYRGPDDRRDLDIIWNPSSEWLVQEAQTAAERFVPELPVVRGKLTRGSSDHASFWRHGFDAIFFFEDALQSSPFIHTVDDVMGISYNDPLLATLCTKTAVALLATLAGPAEVPVSVHSFEAFAQNSGVALRWQLAPQAVRALAGVHVQRAVAAGGPYVRRTVRALPPAVRGAFEDDAVSTGRYWYRLELGFDDGGAPVLSSPLAVRVGMGGLLTALHAPFEPWPGGPLHVRYAIGPSRTPVRLGIYDVRGRLVRVLARGPHEPGEYLQVWDRHDEVGRSVARGIYIVQLRTSRAPASRKVLVLRP
ncbi:MAG: M28 family metallopeptidase [Candidatus Krumholzibacteriia bacterium]